MRLLLPLLTAVALLGACADYRQVQCDLGQDLAAPQPPADLASPTCDLSKPRDLARPACDLARPQDLARPACDLATPPDDPDCGCGTPGHGQGTGHCANHPGIWDGHGHGNGHCKYDCE